jgi:diaminopimelate epimerase
MRFAKGHGTGNDFIVVPDPDGALTLTDSLVARLCDRRFGLGADGILRAVRGEAGGWFMDYRNADGSIGEMCGNGIRVLTRYLLDHGLATGPGLIIGTRGGDREVRAEADGSITVDMGRAEVLGAGSAQVAGRWLPGLAVSLGNPHLACLTGEPVTSFDLTEPPGIDPALFPAGANVEVVRVRHRTAANSGAATGGAVDMRVHERGSGVTLSCGTGAVAAAVAAAAGPLTGDWAAGDGAAGDGVTPAVVPPGTWAVTVPGGTLEVRLTATTSLLTGPAVIVAEGEISRSWLAGPVPARS